MRRKFMKQSANTVNYMYISANRGADVCFSFTSTIEHTLEFRIDGGDWQVISDSEVYYLENTCLAEIRGNIDGYPYSPIGQFFIEGDCEIGGNSLSLIFGDDCDKKDDISDYPSVFYSLFQSSGSMYVAADFLPATKLSEECYAFMFSNVDLREAPELPATTLADSCYYYMFSGCDSLTTAPELPATTLAFYCYGFMFKDCTSLTTAPELPATTLADYCYDSMFRQCDELNYIKMLATDISASGCLDDWVNDVASSGTFVKHAEMEDLPTGENGIPIGWTVENA